MRGGKVTGLRRAPRLRLVAALLPVAVLSGVTFWLGTQVVSPADRAALSAPPRLESITAPVVRKVVSQTLTFTATPSGGRIPVPAVAQDASPVLVVTGLPQRVGHVVSSGDVLAVVSGRPVIALSGPLPAYRDIRPGVSGPDVLQLQRALRALGYLRTTPDGSYGTMTASAVQRLYSAVGFEPALTEPDALRRLAAARTAVTTAQAHRAAAARQPDRQQLAAATAELSQAGDALTALEATSGVVLPRGEVMWLPVAGARISSVGARVGQILSPGDPVVTLSSGSQRLTGTVDDSALATLAASLAGVATDPATQQSWPVHRVALDPATPAATGSKGAGSTGAGGATSGSEDPSGAAAAEGNIAVSLPAGVRTADLPPQVNVVLTTASTRGQVLAVPVSAVTLGADGSTSVVIVGADGRERTVAVQAGLAGDGFVQVSSGSPDLRAGASVVVGAQPASQVSK